MQSISATKLRLFNTLKRKKFRYKHKLFVVEGKKMVQEALSSNWELQAILIHEDYPLDESVYAKDIPVYQLDANQFVTINNLQSPEGIAAIVKFPGNKPDFYTSIQEIPTGNGLILDRVNDPGNAGTILRTIDWFGLDFLICGPGCVDMLNPKCLRSSMGAIFRVPLFQHDDLVSLIKVDPQRVLISDMDGTRLKEVSLKNKAIVIGQEANGVLPAIKQIEQVDRVRIEGGGSAESLNAAVAAGILSWEMFQANG